MAVLIQYFPKIISLFDSLRHFEGFIQVCIFQMNAFMYTSLNTYCISTVEGLLLV